MSTSTVTFGRDAGLTLAWDDEPTASYREWRTASGTLDVTLGGPGGHFRGTDQTYLGGTQREPRALPGDSG